MCKIMNGNILVMRNNSIILESNVPKSYESCGTGAFGNEKYIEFLFIAEVNEAHLMIQEEVIQENQHMQVLCR